MTAPALNPQIKLKLRDGTGVAARPIEPGDALALQRFHCRLSQQSIYFRFFGLVPELSDERARFFSQVDNLHRVALVGLDPADSDEIIAVVRLDREPGSETGEYAAIVEDRWQGRGVGSALTRLLLYIARQRGFRRAFALVLPENNRMLGLLRTVGLPITTRWKDGVTRVDLDLTSEIEQLLPMV